MSSPAATTSIRPRRARHVAGIELPRVADGRRSSARRMRRLVEAYAAELGGTLSALDAGLIRQIAAIALQVEKMQTQIVEGHEVDPDLIIRLSSEHRRLLEILKAKGTKSKPAASTLAQILQGAPS